MQLPLRQPYFMHMDWATLAPASISIMHPLLQEAPMVLAQCLSWTARTGTWDPHGFTHLGTQRGQHYLAGPPLELDALELACGSMLAGHQRGLVHLQHAPTVQCCLPLAACTYNASPTPLGPTPHLPSNKAAHSGTLQHTAAQVTACAHMYTHHRGANPSPGLTPS